MVLPLGDLEKTRIVPLATYCLIALNIVVYLFQLEQGLNFTIAYAATPYEIRHNEDLQALAPFPVRLTILTALFLHGSPIHLASNMLCLWIFGDNVEEVLGTFRYLLVYLACGLMGTLTQIAANSESMIPTLGASGAIAGVMGAYVVWFPHNRVRVLVLRYIVLLPAFVVIGGWIAFQVWEGVGSVGKLGEVGGIAYFAHIGGAATGVLVALFFHDRARKVRDLGDQEEWLIGI